MKTRIIKLLQQNPAGMSHGDIAQALGVPQEQILQCLGMMQDGYMALRSSLDVWHLIALSESPPVPVVASYSDYVDGDAP